MSARARVPVAALRRRGGAPLPRRSSPASSSPLHAASLLLDRSSRSRSARSSCRSRDRYRPFAVGLGVVGRRADGRGRHHERAAQADPAPRLAARSLPDVRRRGSSRRAARRARRHRPRAIRGSLALWMASPVGLVASRFAMRRSGAWRRRVWRRGRLAPAVGFARRPDPNAQPGGLDAHRSREDPQRRRRRPPRHGQDLARRGAALPGGKDEPARCDRGGQHRLRLGRGRAAPRRCRSRRRSATASGRAARST